MHLSSFSYASQPPARLKDFTPHTGLQLLSYCVRLLETQISARARLPLCEINEVFICLF